jgi:Permuted papain-like amidase enzyme, YaeF/YiiX, C92 family
MTSTIARRAARNGNTLLFATLLAWPWVAPAAAPAELSLGSLASQLKVGDVVFIRVPARPFREVADATGSWTNHVGVVVNVDGAEPQIAESTFPLSGAGPLSRFVARSEGGRVAVSRLESELTPQQRIDLNDAARRRSGVFYDTGFDLRSRRQFCSRFVREVLLEATGTPVGTVETFAELLSSRPDANLGFWKLWYFGRIPWERQTVTPASLLHSPALQKVFDGVAHSNAARPEV